MPLPTNALPHILANQTGWLTHLAGTDDTIWRRGEVTACIVADHGHLLIPGEPGFQQGDIDAGLAWLRNSGAERVLIWTDRDIRDFDIALVSRGCGDSWNPRWMLRDLAEPLPAMPVPDAVPVTIEQADLSVLPDLEAASTVPYVNIAESRGILAPHDAASMWMFVARQRPASRIVGHLTVFLPQDGSRWAGLYSAGVVQDMRRRGIGSALTAAGCRAVQAAGARYISLNATPDGERAYRKVGFAIVGDGRTWYLDREALRNWPDPATIQWAVNLARGEFADADPRQATRQAMPNRETPLAFAARFGQESSARWLLEHGAAPEIVPLWSLGMNDDVQQLVTDRESINRLSPPHGKAPLHIAIERNDAAQARLLLEAGANVTVRDGQHGGTPLDWARALGRPELAALIEIHSRG
jgi:ribosomal protein S18 acetylase RimI-like enzyme